MLATCFRETNNYKHHDAIILRILKYDSNLATLIASVSLVNYTELNQFSQRKKRFKVFLNCPMDGLDISKNSY